jgi:hypothetical protein
LELYIHLSLEYLMLYLLAVLSLESL